MAEAPVLNNLVNLTNGTTAVSTINANNAAITTAFEDVLSLSGTAPNQMQSTLDMNTNRIINLPSPSGGTEPVTLNYMNTYLTTGQGVSGLTGVPVSTVMQPIVNASTIAAALSGLGIPNTIQRLNFQIFSSSGTYTPHTGTVYAIIECIGGGGGGGASGTVTSGNVGVGSGGGGGGYACTFYQNPTSQSIIIGAGGTSGNAGGTTYFGSYCAASGGLGGLSTSGTSALTASGGGGGVGVTGNILIYGQQGQSSWACYSIVLGQAGAGGASPKGWGAGGGGGLNGSPSVGYNYGGGGGGAVQYNVGASIPGGTGASGVVFITEFLT